MLSTRRGSVRPATPNSSSPTGVIAGTPGAKRSWPHSEDDRRLDGPGTVPDDIASAVRRVSDRVAAAAERSGRDASAVKIVAAVKYVDVEQIAEAVEAGVTDVGVNRAQDLRDKAPTLPTTIRWHYLGSVQTNKVRYLDPVVLVHSIDRAREVDALNERGLRLRRDWEVLIEVNLAGEQGKQGVAPSDVEDLLETFGAYPRVVPRGFMFVAPQVQNPEDVRWMFAEGRNLRDRFGSFGLEELSMGMSDDFEVAIEEGATIVRIGRAIFGPREPI
jgi:pyridoxal phosphate enzyme (YggS family)